MKEKWEPVVAGQCSCVSRHPGEVEHEDGPAVSNIKVGVEDAAEAEVSPWLHACDGRQWGDGDERHVEGDDVGSILITGVSSGVFLPEVSEADGAVRCDGNAVSLWVGPSPTELHG